MALFCVEHARLGRYSAAKGLRSDPSQSTETVTLGRDPNHVRARKVRWDFAQLHDWYAYLNLHGFQLDSGWTSSGLDEAHNQVMYGVVDEVTRKRYERRLARLGIPCGLVNIEIVGRFQPQ